MNELEMITKAQNGDKIAKDTLVTDNLGLVNKIAGKMCGRNAEFEDLFQVGCMGLMRAIEKYDTQYDIKLGTYAYRWIQEYMVRHIQNYSRAIRIPVPAFRVNYALTIAKRDLDAKLERTATVKELAKHTKKSIKEITTFNIDMLSPLSLNNTVNDDTKTDSLGIIADTRVEDMTTKTIAEEMVELIKNILNERAFKIFIAKIGLYNEAKTFREIGAETDVTYQRVQQIYRNSILMLRRNHEINLYKAM